MHALLYRFGENRFECLATFPSQELAVKAFFKFKENKKSAQNKLLEYLKAYASKMTLQELNNLYTGSDYWEEIADCQMEIVNDLYDWWCHPNGRKMLSGLKDFNPPYFSDIYSKEILLGEIKNNPEFEDLFK